MSNIKKLYIYEDLQVPTNCKIAQMTWVRIFAIGVELSNITPQLVAIIISKTPHW